MQSDWHAEWPAQEEAGDFSVTLCKHFSLISKIIWEMLSFTTPHLKSTFWTTAEISWWCNLAPSLPVNLLVIFFFSIPWCVSWLQNILHTGPLSLFGSGTISLITQHNILLNFLRYFSSCMAKRKLEWSLEYHFTCWKWYLYAWMSTAPQSLARSQTAPPISSNPYTGPRTGWTLHSRWRATRPRRMDSMDTAVWRTDTKPSNEREKS